jgi:hypothetical protein
MSTATAIHINPDDILDDDTLYELLSLGRTTLARPRQSEGLRFVRKGQRTLYLGRWVLDWLESSAVQAEAAKCEKE